MSFATLPTENGRVTLSGTSITTTEKGKRQKEQVSSGKVNYPILPLA
jgi:hypothetical protein